MALRVVQVIPHDDPGGMQQVAQNLNDFLPFRGITSSVLNLRYWIRASSGGAAAPGESRAHKPGRTRAWLRLVRVWRICRPDAVIAHAVMSAAYTLTAARAAGVSRRIAVVHGNRQTVGSIKARVLAGLGRFGFVTDLVFVGHAAAGSFGEIRGPRRCIVIQNGTPAPVATAEPPDVDPALAHLICVSRLVDGKNVQTAIRAAAQATVPVVLHVFGEGNLRSALELLTVELEAPVKFHGHVAPAELSSWYAVGAAFLFPTLGEGLPLVLIEAAAGGVPVIASDRSSNREVMGDAAIYCDPMDDLAWARAVDVVARDSGLRERMRTAGWERRARFTVDRMTDDYAALLRGEG